MLQTYSQKCGPICKEQVTFHCIKGLCASTQGLQALLLGSLSNDQRVVSIELLEPGDAAAAECAKAQ